MYWAGTHMCVAYFSCADWCDRSCICTRFCTMCACVVLCLFISVLDFRLLGFILSCSCIHSHTKKTWWDAKRRWSFTKYGKVKLVYEFQMKRIWKWFSIVALWTIHLQKQQQQLEAPSKTIWDSKCAWK